MKMILIAAFALGMGLAGANGQTTAPAPTPSTTPAPGAEAAPASPSADAKPSGKEARRQRRADAKAQGLKGDARKAAVADCFAKARPDLAARQKCRVEGRSKDLEGGDLRALVKGCKGSIL